MRTMNLIRKIGRPLILPILSFQHHVRIYIYTLICSQKSTVQTYQSFYQVYSHSYIFLLCVVPWNVYAAGNLHNIDIIIISLWYKRSAHTYQSAPVFETFLRKQILKRSKRKIGKKWSKYRSHSQNCAVNRLCVIWWLCSRWFHTEKLKNKSQIFIYAWYFFFLC